jgi:membrane protein
MQRNRRLARLKEVVTAVYVEARAENLSFMAGSIAYHAFVSLLPLLVLVLLVLQQLGGESLSGALLTIVEGAFTEEGRRLIVDTVERGDRGSGLSVLGAVVLLWATLRIFRGIDQAFSNVYETEATNGLADQIADGLLVLGAVVVAVVLVGLVRTTFTLGSGPVGTVLGTLFVLVGLSVALFPLYFVFPDADLRPVEALPGTVAAAVGLTALESLFRVYTQFSTTGESYGVLGGIVVLVTWLYFNGLVLLLGAVLNAVLTNRTADVVLEPVLGDHRVGLGPENAAGEGPVAVAGATSGLAGAVDVAVDRSDGGPLPDVDVSVDADGDAAAERSATVAELRPLANRVETGATVTVLVDGVDTDLPRPATAGVVEGPEGEVELRLRW